MPKSNIQLPGSFVHTFNIPVRITDLNYGDHVGNDSLVSIIHEARVQYLSLHHFTELNIGGAGLIMADLQVEFKKEIFYPSTLQVSVGAGNISNTSFDFFYKVSVKEDDGITDVAYARSKMVAYNYDAKKVTALPAEFVAILSH